MLTRHLADAAIYARRAPFTTAAKVIALALAFAALTAVVATLAYWRSADVALVPKGSRIVEIVSSSVVGPHRRNVSGIFPVVSGPVAKYMRLEMPQLTAVTRFGYFQPTPIKANGRTVVLQGGGADPDTFEVFAFQMVEGDRSALRRQDGIVLTQAAARRLFGARAALGRPVQFDDGSQKVVTGVVGPLIEPSRFTRGRLKFDYLVQVVDPPSAQEWDWRNVATFARLPAHGSLTLDQLNTRLVDLGDRRAPPNPYNPEVRPAFEAMGFEHADELDISMAVLGLERDTTTLAAPLLAVVGLILAVACLNYANLATAQILARTKETATRRILGSDTRDIFLQSGVESTLTVVAALCLCAVMVALGSRVLLARQGADILRALLHNPMALAGVALTALFVSLVCAIYPALMAVRARPADALRAGRRSGTSHGLAPVLVGGQFAIASALIILVMAVGAQNAHIRALALRPLSDPVVSLPPASRGGMVISTLRQALVNDRAIRAIGGRAEPPWSLSRLHDSIGRSRGHMFGPLQAGVEPGYFDVYGQKLLAGRVFDPALDNGLWSMFPGFASPTPVDREKLAVERIVIDSGFARRLGFASPQAAVGALLISTAPYNPQQMQVIGVVEPRLRLVQERSDSEVVYRLSGPWDTNTPIVRLDRNDIDGGLAALRRVWRQYANGAEPDFKFEDQLFEESFMLFNRLQLIFEVLAGVALAISVSGLIGIAVQTTQRRMHEMGVRKVLGSDARQIVWLLLADFAKPVLIANLIAWPAAYFAVQAYLASFASKTPLTPAPFLISLMATLVVAALAVGGQALKAAAVRPAQVLRDA